MTTIGALKSYYQRDSACTVFDRRESRNPRILIGKTGSKHNGPWVCITEDEMKFKNDGSAGASDEIKPYKDVPKSQVVRQIDNFLFD